MLKSEGTCLNCGKKLKGRQKYFCCDACCRYYDKHKTLEETESRYYREGIPIREFIYIMQQRGEVSLFSHNSGYEFSQEGGFLPNLAELRKLVIKEVTNINIACSYTEFMAKFFTDNGLISDLNSVHKLLEEIEAEGIIKIERNPSLTTTGRPTKFWSEKKGQTIVIRRCIR